MTVNQQRFGLVISLTFLLIGVLITPLFAQTKENFAQRHPTATSLAAGAGTTYLLKRSAHNKIMHGEKLNFAERHPYLSGVGVAIVTHHMINKSKHKE